MPATRFSTWLVAALATAASGCHPVTLVASDGQRFTGPVGDWQSALDAMLNASGAHDLRCPPQQVTVRVNPYRSREHWADGCGARVVYDVFDDGGAVRAHLLSRVSLGPPEAVTPQAAP